MTMQLDVNEKLVIYIDLLKSIGTAIEEGDPESIAEEWIKAQSQMEKLGDI